MEVNIDKRKCTRCGFCTEFAKSVFSFNSDGDITVSQINHNDEETVKKASVLCQANAIRINTKKKIKQKLTDETLTEPLYFPNSEVRQNVNETYNTNEKTDSKELDDLKVKKKLEKYKATFNALFIFITIMAVLFLIGGFFIASYYTAIVIGDKLGIILFLCLVLPSFLFLCYVAYHLAKFMPEFYYLVCDLFIKLLDREKDNKTNIRFIVY